MGRSTVHYADSDTNNILKKLHNKLRPAGTPVQRVEYIIELLLLRIFEVKLKQDPEFKDLRKLFTDQNEDLLFSSLYAVANERLLPTLNEKFFPFYATILSEARKVYQKNLGQKVQDQLVLIAEVFKNSNFTNNVKSGNLQEVLGLVGELDEERLLKTDLLGDAIESALSETGGTKDIGLHRTPDHIRHFMVALAAPTFDDTIFDPACGTAGFLFDSFGYVLEGVSQEGHWPGQNAHPELRDFFKKYFVKQPVKMPSQEKAITFYRTGIFGTEYLGMIRKMAAINFYIRGLNPQNIEQGDSLATFDPAKDAGTRTVVLANPPFGAERDQEAYPNVWEEFSRESETTILFVKLMLDALAPGGRCAVIVSEGFLTWDQTSARNLRKMLIEEANLKAVISLPQGVFVSKGGVGPKTSILFFKKGGPTQEVWFYKVTNDGYTMGTNRRPIEGCQLVEALELFDKYVRYGKTPPETKHSFSVPADWVLTLDPRAKQRIEAETMADFGEKEAAERATLADKLAGQVKQGKLSETERTERLTQHAEIWKNKTLNEIAKRIEKAHLYSFNLLNFRSNLSKSQLEEWGEVFKDAQRRNGHSLDERFAALKDSLPEKAHSALALLNVQNALEFDIARQYLMGYPPEELEKHNQLAELRKIIESGAKYPRCILGELLEPKYERIKKDDFNGQYDIIEKISFADGQIHIRELSETGMDLYLADKGDVITSKINVHQGAVALSPRRLACSTHYQVYRTTPDCRGDYLVHILRSPQFLSQLLEQKNKGIKNEQGSDFLLSFDVPLPELEMQESVSKELERLCEMVHNSETIERLWFPSIEEHVSAYQRSRLGDYIQSSIYGTSKKADYSENGVPVLRIGNIGFCEFSMADVKRVNLSSIEVEKYALAKNDFLIVRSNGNPALVGKCAVWPGSDDLHVFASYLIRFRFDVERIDPHFVMFYLMSKEGRSLLEPKQGGGTYNISASTFKEVQIPIPPLESQKILVNELTAKMSFMKQLRSLADESTSRIAQLQRELWGTT